MPVDEGLRLRVVELIGQYDAESYGVVAEDADFMRAALHTLLGEFPAADTAIRLAIHAGDQSPSASHLRLVLDRRLLSPL